MNTHCDLSKNLERMVSRISQTLMRKSTGLTVKLAFQEAQIQAEASTEGTCKNGVCTVVWKPNRPAA